MTSKFNKFLAVAGVLAVSACAWNPPTKQAFWQRVDDNSALWMTGPKAQQTLDENIATCVREVDELVELGALRETLPPDTHSEYHRALKASGDLDYYDTPTRYGDHHVSHKDYHDFDSCMRSKGWERVSFVRYQVAKQANQTNNDLQSIRQWGVPAEEGAKLQQEKTDKIKGTYSNLNK
ncbi:MAG TPA: hypothetical protein VEF76_12630 [Patescibacteria group bacterium]|nr:hypothetical protein [Patescibacteria group bacterium]